MAKKKKLNKKGWGKPKLKVLQINNTFGGASSPVENDAALYS